MDELKKQSTQQALDNSSLVDEECEESFEGEELFNQCSNPEVLGSVLNSVMSEYFEYKHNDGTTLNIADILLLIRQSIDKNTDVQQRLLEVLSVNGPVSVSVPVSKRSVRKEL